IDRLHVGGILQLDAFAEDLVDAAQTYILAFPFVQLPHGIFETETAMPWTSPRSNDVARRAVQLAIEGVIQPAVGEGIIIQVCSERAHFVPVCPAVTIPNVRNVGQGKMAIESVEEIHRRVLALAAENHVYAGSLDDLGEKRRVCAPQDGEHAILLFDAVS